MIFKKKKNKKNKNLYQVTNGYVFNKDEVMLVKTSWKDVSNEERILFQGTMMELRIIYRDNNWHKAEVVRLCGNWGDYKGLVIMINPES